MEYYLPIKKEILSFVEKMYANYVKQNYLGTERQRAHILTYKQAVKKANLIEVE
jgi:hypothetical protein